MRFAVSGRACAALIAWTVSLAAVAAPAPPPVVPVESAASPRIASQVAFDELKRQLDRITIDTHNDRLSEDEFAALRRELQQVRDDVRAEVERLEPRLVEVEGRLSQLGPAPAAGAPPEDASVAADRARLTRLRNNLDAALKQGRLLAVQADQIAERISQYRRRAFLRELFQHSSSALDPSLWRQAAAAARDEAAQLTAMARTWGDYARDNGGVVGAAMALLGSVGLIIVGALALRWLRRRSASAQADTRFARARVALSILVRHAAAMPVAAGIVVVMLDSCSLAPDAVVSLGYGLVAAVAVASFGRAVAVALLAPARTERRLVQVDDAMANRLASTFTWAARAFGAGIFLNVVHRAVNAPAVLPTATNVLVAFVIGALMINVLVRRWPGDDPASARAPQVQWLRVGGCLIAAVIMVSLVTGHVGLSMFVASRAVIVPALIGALFIGLTFVDQLFAAELSADSERGRRLAGLLGLSPRGMELVGTLLSAVLRVLLVVVALVPLFARWGLSTADVFDLFEGALTGFRVGEITISLTAISGALLLILVGILLTRVVQRWLETQVLPRTALEPGLQNSISALVGYAGLITVVSLGLATLGIDLQKIALVAGALSVGIGFGLQSVVSNFVSGIILLAERPIRVGDIVEVKGESGWVRKISVRATEIETFERASMIVPNSALITDVVKNWTHGNPTSRIIVKIGVGYDSDPEQVRNILNDVAAEHPLVLTSPQPRVLFARFGDSALEFELRCVVANVDQQLNVTSDLHFAILQRFRAAGISIPYPQREVRIIGEKT